jgi:hypothetical protein
MIGPAFFILGPDGPGVVLSPHMAFAAFAAALVLHATNMGLMLGLVTMLKRRGF